MFLGIVFPIVKRSAICSSVLLASLAISASARSQQVSPYNGTWHAEYLSDMDAKSDQQSRHPAWL